MTSALGSRSRQAALAERTGETLIEDAEPVAIEIVGARTPHATSVETIEVDRAVLCNGAGRGDAARRLEIAGRARIHTVVIGQAAGDTAQLPGAAARDRLADRRSAASGVVGAVARGRVARTAAGVVGAGHRAGTLPLALRLGPAARRARATELGALVGRRNLADAAAIPETTEAPAADVGDTAVGEPALEQRQPSTRPLQAAALATTAGTE